MLGNLARVMDGDKKWLMFREREREEKEDDKVFFSRFN